MDKVPSNTTLWRLIRKFEGKELNFTQRGVAELASGTSGAGRIFYEMPVLNILGRDLTTFGDLQKSLAQLGVNSGSVAMRLSFKKTDQPLEVAVAEIGQYFKEEEASTSSDVGKTNATMEGVETVTEGIARLPSAEPSSSDDKDINMASLDTSQETSQDPSPNPEPVGEAPVSITPSKRPASEPEEAPEGVLGPDGRPIQVFAAPSTNTPKAALLPHNETDFEPSIIHATQHQRHLQNRSQNQRLLSDAEAERLEKERAEKLAATKEVQVKIRFPDQQAIVSTFSSEYTGAELYGYVRKLMAAEDQPFKLVYKVIRPETVPNNDKAKLIKDLGFKGRVLIDVVWEDGASEAARKQSSLKPEFSEKAKEVTVPQVPGVDEAEAGPSDGTGQEQKPEAGKKKGNLMKMLGSKLSKR
jgi:tether containing UBX domain for GLUT4